MIQRRRYTIISQGMEVSLGMKYEVVLVRPYVLLMLVHGCVGGIFTPLEMEYSKDVVIELLYV